MKVNINHAAFSAAIALHGLILVAGIRQEPPVAELPRKISVRLQQVAEEIPVTRPEPPRPPAPQEARKVENPSPRDVARAVPTPERPIAERPEKPVQHIPSAVDPVPHAILPSAEVTPAAPQVEAVRTQALPQVETSQVVGPNRLGEYLELVRKFVEMNKEYPSAARQLGQQGSVLVRVRILADGTLAEVDMVTSSGHRYLDRAAVAAVRKATPLKAPAGFGLKDVVVEIPIVFRLI